MKEHQKEKNKDDTPENREGERCETARCGCSVNYILLGITVIFLVFLVAAIIE